MNEPVIDRQKIVRQLRDVIDPELGVNIVDLGLVYNILIDGGMVTIEYTVTTPGCPMRRYLEQQIEETLRAMDGVEDFEIQLVWEPEWSVDMIKENVDFFYIHRPRSEKFV